MSQVAAPAPFQPLASPRPELSLLCPLPYSLKKNTHTYFYTSFVAYIFGLGLTIFIMHIFKHAQVSPAPLPHRGTQPDAPAWPRVSRARQGKKQLRSLGFAFPAPACASPSPKAPWAWLELSPARGRLLQAESSTSAPEEHSRGAPGARCGHCRCSVGGCSQRVHGPPWEGGARMLLGPKEVPREALSRGGARPPSLLAGSLAHGWWSGAVRDPSARLQRRHIPTTSLEGCTPLPGSLHAALGPGGGGFVPAAAAAWLSEQLSVAFAPLCAAAMWWAQGGRGRALLRGNLGSGLTVVFLAGSLLCSTWSPRASDSRCLWPWQREK